MNTRSRTVCDHREMIVLRKGRCKRMILLVPLFQLCVYLPAKCKSHLQPQIKPASWIALTKPAAWITSANRDLGPSGRS
jgi:hypothetical protein